MSFLIFASSCASYGMWSSGIVLHASATVDSKLEMCVWSASFSFKACIFSANIFSLFTLYSLIRLKARCSLVLNSSATPIYNAWRVSFESATIFSHMFLIVLRIMRSSMDSAWIDPSGKDIVLRSRVLAKFVAWLVSVVRIACSTLAGTYLYYAFLDLKLKQILLDAPQCLHVVLLKLLQQFGCCIPDFIPDLINIAFR